MDAIPFLKQLRALRGFTLIEMLVVLAIIVIITAIAIVGQTSFNKTLVLTNTAYNLALSIREAQSYGLSTRAFGTVQNSGYGVRLNRAALTTYSTYADIHPVSPGTNSAYCPGHTERTATNPEARPGNCYYSNVSELIKTYTFNRGFKINRFCGTTSGGTETCSTGSLTTMDIVFLRPNTETIITGNNATLSFAKATIVIEPPDASAERCITVTALGGISVGLTCQ